MANHVLGSTFAPPSTFERLNGSVTPAMLENSLRVLAAGLSGQIAKHLEPISNQVHANQATLNKLEDSVLLLSEHMEARRSTNVEASPDLQHLDSAMNKLGLHLKAAECNQQLSLETLRRLNSDILVAGSKLEKSKSAAESITEASPEQLLDIHARHVESEEDEVNTPATCNLVRADRATTPPMHVKSVERKVEQPADWEREVTPPDEFSGDNASKELRRIASHKTLGWSSASGTLRYQTRHQTTMLAVIRDEIGDLEKQTSSALARRCFHKTRKLMTWWIEFKVPRRQGPCAEIVDSMPFELFFGFVIVVDTVTMTIAVNHQMGHTQNLDFQIPSLMCLIFYCAELAMRISVHRWYFFVGAEYGWHIFDVVVVAVLLYSNITTFFIRTGQSANVPLMQTLRLVKLIRVFRVLRLVHFLRVLHIFSGFESKLNILVGSLGNTLANFVIMASVLYLFGVIMVQDLTGNFSQQNDVDPVQLDQVRSIFGSVQLGMFTLFRSAFHGEDWDKYYQVIAETSSLSAAIFIFFVGFLQTSLFNVFIANFVLRAEILAKPDDQTRAMEETLKQRQQAEQIQQLCEKMDLDGTHTISREDFHKSLESVHTRALFVLCGIDDPEDFFDLLGALSNDNEVEIDKFVDVCMQMKGAASSISQQQLLLEVRDFRHKVANNFLGLRYWQREVNDKLAAISEGSVQ